MQDFLAARPLNEGEIAVARLLHIQGYIGDDAMNALASGNYNVAYTRQGNFTIAAIIGVESTSNPLLALLGGPMSVKIHTIVGAAVRNPRDADDPQGAQLLAFERAVLNGQAAADKGAE